jgi:zinc transporter ZupT
LYISSQILTNNYSPDLEKQVTSQPQINDIDSTSRSNSHHHGHNHQSHQHGHHRHTVTKAPSVVLPYLLIAGLCIDGLFEGIAIGVQDNWIILLFVSFGIMVNKAIIGLSFGLILKKAGLEMRSIVIFNFFFAVFAPMGILVAFFLDEFPLAHAVLLSLASGAFLYVSGSVIIIEEFTMTHYRWSKYLIFLIGAGSTGLIIAIGNI